MYTPIQLDKVRNFRFGMKAISLIEQQLKTNIAKVNLDELSMCDTAVFIWAGLSHEDADLTPDKVMDLVDEHSNLPDVLASMTEALTKSFGAAEGKKNLAKVTK